MPEEKSGPVDVDDLASLPELNDASVVSSIKLRFTSNKIYTRINNLLIAMNPYQLLPIYTKENMQSYKAAPVGSVPPHVYGTSAAAYSGLLALESQSIVISGESGAGKSETAKKVLQFLAFAASRSGQAEGDGIEARILASSPPLEAFGNAKTSMNNNSSRYGKFLMLNFDVSGQLASAHIKTYLLEKTRVVSPGPNERGYHIGYMLCQDAGLRSALTLPAASELQYLGRTGCLVSPGWDDAEELAACLKSFASIGVSDDELTKLWRVIAALHLLGELDFGPSDAAEATIGDRAKLEQMCALVEVDPEPTSRAFTVKNTKMGADWIQAPIPPDRASELRHGLARSMYSTCFDWLVRQINGSLHIDAGDGRNSRASRAEEPAPAAPGGAAQQFIGILDIFGFETFKTNSLEQLCINYCNERLQSTFNEAVFRAVQEENAAEGVDLPEADLSEIDNAAVVKMIGGKPHGVLHMLNEECVVPKGTDTTLLDKMLDTHKQNPLIAQCVKVKQGFTIQHFVGPVTYVTTNILLKNKDPVSEDLMVLLQRSQSTFVQSLFASKSETKALTAKKKDTRFKGVAAKFQQQLEELLKLIGLSHMHFIRCIKPNRDKVPSAFLDELVVGQLRCSGVFEAVRVIGMGFPDRLPHFIIIGQYARLLPEEQRPEVDDDGNLALTEAAAVADVLGKLDVLPEEFAIGVSKVFLKAGVLARLRQRQQDQMAEKAVVIQAAARGYLDRNRVMLLREERQRQLEAEAAAALAAALEAEAAAKAAAAAFDRAVEMAAQSEAEAAAQHAEAGALHAALQADEQIARASAAAAISDAEQARSKMGFGAENGLGESRWRSKLRKGSMQMKLKAIASMGGASGNFAKAEDEESLEQQKVGMQLLTQRSQSRKILLSGELDGALGGEQGDAGGKAQPAKKPGLNLSALAGGNLALNTSMLSHREQGGGVAPLMSARAPVRKNVKKAAAKQKKDAQWMEMVLEYATYLGMDPSEDSELLWIAEQALRAPVPELWEEMMDPFGDLYFFNETTAQSTRQHPMDSYYQQLYLKLRLQRAGGFASSDMQQMMPPPPPPPEEKSGGKKRGKRSSIAAQGGRLADRGGGGMTARESKAAGGGGTMTSRGGMSTSRWQRGGQQGSLLGSFLEEAAGGLGAGTFRGGAGNMTMRDGMTARTLEAQRHVISSVSEALEMASPRSAKFMLDRFGLNDESKEDERCLLVNPAVWRVPPEGDEVPFIECVMDKEDLGLGLCRYSLYICLNDNNEAFALGALKRVQNQNTMYELSMSEADEVDVHYTGKLSCNARGNEFVLYDDSNDAIGIREGKARRELGVIVFGQRQHGNAMPIELVVPRVQRDGQSAQFRPKTLGEAMIQQYKNGKTKHLFVLKGLALLMPGGSVQLKFRGGEQSAVVFEAFRATDDRWTVRYRHPLSAYQAFTVAIAVMHNQTTQLLDLLSPLDAVPRAPDPPLATNLVQIDKLEHAYGVVYSMCVFGSRVFCGMHSGHVQQWQCPLNSPPTVIEWRAHSGTVYALMVAGRSLITGSRDWLLRVWDLASLTLVATLPGHRGTVRCLAGAISKPNVLFSGSNDKRVRVWDLNALHSGDPKPGKELKGHRGWVRAVACSATGDLLCSAALDIRVWSTHSYTSLYTIPVGRSIFCLSICRVSVGAAHADTLYAGCSNGQVRAWRFTGLKEDLNEAAGVPTRLERRVRAMACHGHVLLCGDQHGHVRAWDLSKSPAQGYNLAGDLAHADQAHSANVRALSVDTLTNVVYSAGDDRCVRAWAEAPNGGAPGDNYI